MPQYGFRTAGFKGWTAEESAAELARLGYDCVELCLEAPDVRPELLDEQRCAALRRTLDGLDIGLASVSYHGDVEPPAERAANQERAVRIAGWLGTGLVIVNGNKAVDAGRQWDEHVARLARLCSVAEEAGVTLAFEPEPQLIVSSTDDMVAMLQAVGSPRLKVNLDVGHAQVTDDDPAASVRRLGSAIVHLHLEDIKGRVHRHLPLGEGDIDFAALRRALADIGYAGPYVVDLSQLGDPVQDAARALAVLHRLFG